MKVFALIFFSLFFFLSEAYSQVSLDIFITHKKGIDKDLILTSELQSSERIVGKELRILEMRNGIRVEIGAEFVEDWSELIGPSSHVRLLGALWGPQRKLWLNFEDLDKRAYLGEEFSFTFSDDIDQIVEIRVKPWL
jgi:hypothetical protein